MCARNERAASAAPRIWARRSIELHAWTRRAGPALRGRLTRALRSFSPTGLLLATLFFAASLTPSLIPRTWLTQGVLSGISLAAGYGIGAAAHWVWVYLELPEPSGRLQRNVKRLAAGVSTAVAIAFLWQASAWQNSVRLHVQMPPVDQAEPFRIALTALAVFAILIAVLRLFQLTCRSVSRHLRRHMPSRLSHLLGIVAGVALFWSLADGVLFTYALRSVDVSFRKFDALIEPDVPPPDSAFRTGSPASLVDWEDLGWAGRRFVASGPRRSTLETFLHRPAREPIRVFVGLNAAETPQERARLALEELKRTGAFERKILIVVTPPGTGWIDGAAIDTVEYLHRGDMASVAVQYSYLPSWLSLLIDPEKGVDTAQALFQAVYDHWRTLPADSRPRLYLHGVSLGAMNSDRSTDMFDVIGEPFHGALWSGPPFSSDTWRTATENRLPTSPAWLPRFRDGSIIRFANQHRIATIPGAEWGPVRILFLQYASDPVTFFEPTIFYRRPDWMAFPRGPDVSPALRWYPVVTQLQLAVDMMSATETPSGHGHVYAAVDYIDAWSAVTEPEGWNAEDLRRLKHLFAVR